MAALKEKALTILGQVVDDDFNVTTDTNIFVVPVGKVATVVMVVLSDCSADLSSSTVTLGQSGGKTDFLNTQTLSGLNASGSAGVLQPVPNATTVEIQTYTAGEIFVIDHVVAAGSGATATITAFGFLEDA